MAFSLRKANTLWQTVGGSILAPILIVLVTIDSLVYGYLSTYAMLLWLNVAFLFFHEFEGYVLNPKRKSHSVKEPKSEILVFAINGIAWIWAILAALFANSLPWLGISFLITNSLINCFTHTVLFQLSHKSYNPGLITVIFLFIPLYTITLWYTIAFSILSTEAWSIGIVIGIAMTLLLTAALRTRTS